MDIEGRLREDLEKKQAKLEQLIVRYNQLAAQIQQLSRQQNDVAVALKTTQDEIAYIRQTLADPADDNQTGQPTSNRAVRRANQRAAAGTVAPPVANGKEKAVPASAGTG